MVSTETSLWAGHLRIHSLITGRSKRFFSFFFFLGSGAHHLTLT